MSGKSGNGKRASGGDALLRKIAAKLDRIEGGVGGLKKDVGGLRRGMAESNARLGRLEGGVGGLKKDVGVLKGDVGVLKEDVVVLKGKAGDIEIRLCATEEQMRAEMRKMTERTLRRFDDLARDADSRAESNKVLLLSHITDVGRDARDAKKIANVVLNAVSSEQARYKEISSGLKAVAEGHSRVAGRVLDIGNRVWRLETINAGFGASKAPGRKARAPSARGGARAGA